MKKYKAYIASNGHSQAFDNAAGKTAKSALAAIKRKNSPDWRDCCTWVVLIRENGEEKIHPSEY